MLIIQTGFLCPLWANPSNANVDVKGLALEGYDPVSYFSQEAKSKGPAKGKSLFAVKHDNRTYHFSSDVNRKEFLNNPNKYTPSFGGWCAYAIAETKEKVSVDPKSFLIQEGRLLLFYDGFLADTRKKWLNHKTRTPAQYLKMADTHWQELQRK